MNSQIINRIRDFYKNPIKFFGFILVLLTLVLLFGCHFHFPEFYTNRELADNIAQTVLPNEVGAAVKHLLNPRYNLYNTIFQLWGYFVIAFVFSFVFKIKEFKNFKEIAIFNKKLIVYFWINLSYIFWGLFYVSGYMIDLYKYVYNSYADSMGIPLFSMISALTFIGIIYYPIINILSFITYNTKIRRFFYKILWGLCFLLLLIVAVGSFTWKFTYINLFLDSIYFIWFFFIVYAIRYTIRKDI